MGSKAYEHVKQMINSALEYTTAQPTKKHVSTDDEPSLQREQGHRAPLRLWPISPSSDPALSPAGWSSPQLDSLSSIYWTMEIPPPLATPP